MKARSTPFAYGYVERVYDVVFLQDMTNLNDFELENLNQLDGSPIRMNLAMLVNDVVDKYGQPLKDGD